MSNRFVVGDKALVIRGERRGWIGDVRSVTRISGGLIDLGIEFPNDKGIAHSFPSEDCKHVNEDDIENYLTAEEKRNILYRIYSEKAEIMITEAIKNRTLGSSLTDQVLAAVADKFIKENFNNILPFMIHRFETVIKSDKPLVEDGDSKSFAESIQWNLERYAGKYIDEHSDEISKLMKDKIHQVAEDFSKKTLSKVISNKLKDTMEKSITEIIDHIDE